MTQFKIGDRVGTLPSPLNLLRIGGVVKYIACYDATTSGGKTCDKKVCSHSLKDYVWVLWPGQIKTFSYKEVELCPDNTTGAKQITLPNVVPFIGPPVSAQTAFFKGSIDPFVLSTRVGSAPISENVGMHCAEKTCNQYVSYAEPNMPNGKFKCHSCRSR